MDRTRRYATGLNRNGKSCRLCWVNYLHPGLKRGCVTPREEQLILELHGRWGNRWSRIARELPGRTDNEIKNYWRTLMRKKAQEMKRNASPCSSSTSGSHMSSLSEPRLGVNAKKQEINASGSSPLKTTVFGDDNEEIMKCHSMDQIWNDIVSSDNTDEVWKVFCPPTSPITSNTPWRIDAEERKMFCHTGGGLLISNCHFGGDPYG